MALTPYHSRVEAQPRKCLGVSSGAALDLETGSRRDLPEKADYVQGDKDGCQLSLQSVLAASLAQKPGGVRSESPCVS
ncbi:unnamed protein product [Rangifer tarandus platyrhynchus]|uniref:Uncharacterized protein n=2 Tax=Rangifer tarandus platyrhynchus TaxID=3082113 RepID=A0ABN8YS55_RANTA|nr:unnamed protein product [Rangifer tarandus platyrhynchus]CAI9702043.1 unnamed protein product [Rangifer tarandus platyrhynchus]